MILIYNNFSEIYRKLFERYYIKISLKKIYIYICKIETS